MSNAPAFAARGRLWAAPAIIPALLVSPAPSAPATRGEPFGSGGVLAPQSEWPLTTPHATSPSAVPMVPAGQVALALSARFSKGAPLIDGGLTWRVYSAKRDTTGTFSLVKEDKSPAPA